MQRKKFPYGIPNFRRIAEENYVFVDKTEFVENLESLGEPYIFFFRPRKFGKSLFVSMLEYYYDISHTEKFEQLFGDFYIGKNPTPLHNSYLVLLFDFSGIDTTDRDTTYKGFLQNVKIGVSSFLNKLGETETEEILSYEEPENLMKAFLGKVKEKTDKKIYLLIDEYDHFANELLAFRIDLFKDLVSRTGFVRKFYEVLKTGARDGVVDRMFITGVTPITLDSFTSGFNIGKNLSLSPNFHDMLGFTKQDTYNLVKMTCVSHPDDTEKIYSQMIKYYNGYKFSDEIDNRLFNPDMVLYYLSEYVMRNSPPRNLIDVNVASDYKKIGNLINLLETEMGREIIHNLMEQDEIAGNLNLQFNLEIDFNRDDLLSLLLYMGFITIERQRGARYVFRIPNYVIKELYYRYFYELLDKRYSVSIRRELLDDSVETMAYDGDIIKFVKLTEEFLGKVLSNRDFIGFKEGHLKVHILTLLYLNGLYYVQSEMEAEKGYVDIFLRERQPFEVNYEWVLELKYLKKQDMDRLEELEATGEKQLREYMKKVTPQTKRTLKGVLLIFAGTGECVCQKMV